MSIAVPLQAQSPDDPPKKKPILSHAGVQQQLRISGSAKDSLGNYLRGTGIFVKDNPSIGTTTDLNGLCVLNVPKGAILVFRMAGYAIQEVARQKND
ncbi:hypothetical protein [Sphingobacterium sp.]|uniref:hypothetical protein n=1 Tax=Sphingobacterium sp. TaxID=341027 RepID=UPI0031D3A951